MTAIIVAVFIFLLPCVAHAEYIATGEIKANECSDYILFQTCKMRPVYAAKGSDGRLYTVATRYPTVSDFNESKGRCWINTKSIGGGLLSMGLNAMYQPKFYEQKEDGSFSEIDAEYLVFPCRKTP